MSDGSQFQVCGAATEKARRANSVHVLAAKRMWANAQCNGRPAKYRWHPLFNAAKFGWRPVLECRAVTLPRRQTRNPLKFAGVPQTPKPFSAVSRPSSPYYMDMWRRYCYLTSFFPIVDTCLTCENVAQQSCAMVPRWRIFGNFWVLHFQWAACSTFQTRILNLH